MRLGLCGSIDEAAVAVAAEAGFDYIEAGVQGLLRGDEDDDTWAPPATTPALPIEAANGLVPGHHKTVGPDRDMPTLERYMARVVSRAARVGIHTLVFGSGGSRQRPEGVSLETAHDQIVEFVAMAGRLCADHGVTLVIEHLNKRECNVINSLAESILIVERVNLPSVRGLIDSYHAGLENETIQSIEEIIPMTTHVHVAEPAGRAQPGAAPADQTQDLLPLLRALHRARYAGGISIEARWTGPVAEHGKAAVAYLRQAWEKASA